MSEIKQKGNTLLIVVIIIAAVVAVGYFAFGRGGIDTAPVPLPAPGQETGQMDSGTVDQVTKEMAMKNNAMLVANLVDVSGGNSSGTGYVLRENGRLVHWVEATLPDPQGDNFYEGWLVQQKPTLKFFSTGELTKNDDGMYSLSFMSENEYEGYNFVVITLETIRDATPEKHIIEALAE